MTGSSMEALQRVSCVRYPVSFQKNLDQVQALIDSGSQVNAMTPVYTKKLGLSIRKVDVDAQEIDGTTLANYGMAIASFSL